MKLLPIGTEQTNSIVLTNVEMQNFLIQDIANEIAAYYFAR